MNSKRLAIGASLLVLAAIIFVTVSPAGWRPHTGYDQAERVIAFALLGGAVWLVLRAQPVIAVSIVLSIALGLEAAQMAVPGRHPDVLTALLKATGGLLGCLVASLILDATTIDGRYRLRTPRTKGRYAAAFAAIVVAILVVLRLMQIASSGSGPKLAAATQAPRLAQHEFPRMPGRPSPPCDVWS